MREITLGIIKPDAVAAGRAGKILDRIFQEGFAVRAMKLVQLTPQQAAEFYKVHRERPFYNELVRFMSEGPCIVMALERENAIQAWRQLMGATDPAVAAPMTLRALYAESIERNAVHGSDSPENAQRELYFFFSDMELLPEPIHV
ncbi:MAG: nucleoside-diphosphate kinase [Bacteroidia bacterium]